MDDQNRSPRTYLERHRVERLELSKAAAATRIGVHPKTLARWESGRIASIRPYELRRLAAVYGLPFAALRAAEEARASGRSGSRWEDAMDAELDGVRTGDDLLEPTREWLSSEPVAVSANTGSPQIDVRLVAHLESLVLRLRWLDDEVGGMDLLPIAQDRYRRIAGLLAGSYTDAVGRRLHACAADVGQLAGWLAYDSGQQGLAQRYWTTALRAARVSGDRSLGANVLAGMALQACALGNPADGSALIETAERGLGSSRSPRVGSLLASRRAVAAAELGQRAECESALGRAETLLDTAVDGDDTPAWIYYYGRGDALLHAGTCWLALDQPVRAESALLDALDALGPGYVRDRVVTQTRIATARVARREIEAASSMATDALLLAASQLNSVRAGDELADLDRALSHFRGGVPAAAEFHDRYETLVAL